MFYSFKTMEEILRKAIHLPTIKIKRIAEETGLGLSGLYAWASGKNRIGIDTFDILLEWFEDNRPDALKAAETIITNGWCCESVHS